MDMPKRNLKTDLNRMNPAAAYVKLGDVVDELIAANNAMAAKIDVLTAKLNADGGVTDTNYAVNFASTLNVKTISER
jgi:hypothetical protein